MTGNFQLFNKTFQQATEDTGDFLTDIHKQEGFLVCVNFNWINLFDIIYNSIWEFCDRKGVPKTIYICEPISCVNIKISHLWTKYWTIPVWICDNSFDTRKFLY